MAPARRRRNRRQGPEYAPAARADERGIYVENIFPNTNLLKGICTKNFRRFSRKSAPSFFQNMVAKMFSNSPKMSRKVPMFCQKIEKCRAFCRGRTCTVGKIQMVLRRIRGWPGVPRSQPRPRGIFSSTISFVNRPVFGPELAAGKNRDFLKPSARDLERNAPFGPPRVSLGSTENSVGELLRLVGSGASSRPVARKVVQKHPFSTLY